MFFCLWVDVCSWNCWIVSSILLNELFTWMKIVGHLASCLKKRTQVGYVNSNPHPPPASNEAEKDPLSGRWPRKAFICISDGLWLARPPGSLPAPFSRFLFVGKHRALAASPGRCCSSPGQESCRCFPPQQWLQSSWSGGTRSTCSSEVCCVLQSLAWGLQTAALTLPSPLPNLFFAPEGLHDKHSSEATLNLLKEKSFH